MPQIHSQFSLWSSRIETRVVSDEVLVTESDGIILVGSVEGNEACEVMVMTGLPLTVVVDAPAWPAGEVVVVPEVVVAGWLTSKVEDGTHALGSLDEDDDEA